MQHHFLTGLILVACASAAQAQTAPAPALSPGLPPALAKPERDHAHDKLFVSPMGEPFRGEAPQEMWFRGADTNHDGAISRAEFNADAMRFFAKLDREHDGEIDPEDIEYYETELLPETRVGDDATTESASDSSGNNSGNTLRAARIKLGAARYSYFDFPEPVVILDRNFNRGIDATEFQRGAAARFAALDTNGDGVIQHDELPHYAPPSNSRRGDGD